MYVLLIILVRETVVKVQLEPLKYLIAWEIFQKNAGIGKMNESAFEELDEIFYIVQPNNIF